MTPLPQRMRYTRVRACMCLLGLVKQRCFPPSIGRSMESLNRQSWRKATVRLLYVPRGVALTSKRARVQRSLTWSSVLPQENNTPSNVVSRERLSEWSG